ncbi:hypothetical protein NMG60_11004614 [Bertholletia excelsa]
MRNQYRKEVYMYCNKQHVVNYQKRQAPAKHSEANPESQGKPRLNLPVLFPCHYDFALAPSPLGSDTMLPLVPFQVPNFQHASSLYICIVYISLCISYCMRLSLRNVCFISHVPLFSSPLPSSGAYLFVLPTTSFPQISSYGPPTYPLVGCLLSFYQNRHRLLNWYTELLSNSPTRTIVIDRLGANRIVLTADPDNVEYILKTNFDNYPKGKPFTDILGDLLGLGIFNADGALWSTQRKLASHEFSTKSLREFVVNVLEEVVENRLVPILDCAAARTEPLDLQDVLRRFAFDTICKFSLDFDPVCLDLSKPPSELAVAFDAAAAISARRAAAPVQALWKVKRWLNVGSEKELRQAVELVHTSVSGIIRDKREKLDKWKKQGGAEHVDLLSRMLAAGHSGELVRDMVISFLMAGRDTTSAAMTWLFWLLMSHRKVEREIVREAADLSPGKKSLDFEELREMNYLKACLCEAMRLYPPVVWDSKHAAATDVLPDGTHVNQGDRVTYFPYGMGRMEDLWGKDRLEFRPDRWLVEPGRELRKVSPYEFPVFQAGPRVCLGRRWPSFR